MVEINGISISPPLINTSCAWASSLEQLQALYDSPYTGAVTTRTATVEGYGEDTSNTFAFAKDTPTSINSYGYSPNPLSSYISWVTAILSSSQRAKPFIISITDISDYDLLLSSPLLSTYPTLILIEFNLSCPNIPGAPPKGYSPQLSLPSLLERIQLEHSNNPRLTFGLKLPPFVYEQQYTDLLDMIPAKGSGISFLTCTNTLGSSLLFTSGEDFALPTPLGGLAGSAIHSLALGNIYTWAQLLKKKGLDTDITLIGVGGVTSKDAVQRMRKVGADVVGCATMLGMEGVKCFETLST